MKRFFTIFCLVSIYVSTYKNASAQDAAAFQIKGKLSTAKQTNLDDVTVQLLRAKDSSIVKVEFPTATGDFSFDKIAAGNYKIRTSHLNFYTYRSAEFQLAADLNFGTIELKEKNSTLKEVTVTSTKPFVQQQFDKTVLNVENSVMAAGSTALEVLEKAPGITVDRDDNINMRGKQGLMVLIDGKRVPMSGAELATMLRGMSANQIERIDLITNPSSRYDASGNAGIIDIRLKKDKRNGTNGSVSASIGEGKYLKSNEGINLNMRNNKLNLFGSYNYVYRKDYNDLQIYRQFYDNGAFTGGYDQKNFFGYTAQTQNARIGADYYISPKTIIGVVGSGIFTGIDRNTDNASKVFNNQSQYTSSFLTTANNGTDRNNKSLNVNFKQTLDSAGKELTADLDYARFNTGDLQNYTTNYFDLNQNLTRTPYLLFGDLNGQLNIRSAKVDYTQPLFGKNGRLEAGLKSSWVNSDNDVKFFDRSNGGNTLDASKSNRFLYEENINAAYINLNKNSEKFSYQLGLRLENTIANGKQLSDNVSFDRSYTQLFPSGYVGYKFNKKHELGLSLSRRINRPTYNQLNPFKYFLDPSTYATGNPALKPELTYSFELTHTFNQKIITKYSYSRTTDNMLSVLSPDASQTNVVIQTNRNLATLDYYGVSVSVPVSPAKWFNSVNNVTMYYGLYSGNLVNTNLRKGVPSLNFNTNNTLIINATTTAEVVGSYQSREIYGFLDIRPIWSLSGGISKQFWEKRASVKLNITDAFLTNKVNAKTELYGYDERFYQRRDTRVATLNLTYRFGKSQVAPSRKRTGGAEDEKRRAG